MTPGERLRLLRMDKGKSVEFLAEIVGKSASTVRAHENGQNNINPQMAIDYASALDVHPGYILYGFDAAAIDAETPLSVPIIGEARAGVWTEDVGNREAETVKIQVSSIHRQFNPQFALLVSGDSASPDYPDGTLVFADNWRQDLAEGDHVVVRRMRFEMSEITIRRVNDFDAKDQSTALNLLNPKSTGAKRLIISFKPVDESLAMINREYVDIIGIVVASFRYTYDAKPNTIKIVDRIQHHGPYPIA